MNTCILRFILTILIIFATCYITTAQGEDPAVKDMVIAPNNITQLNQEVVISFKIGNIGSGTITGADMQKKVGFILTFSKLRLKDEINLLQNVSGAGTAYFDFTFLPESRTIIGKQKNKPFTASDMQEINISFIYSGTANNSTPDIGGTINIQPPVQYRGITENDNASVYSSFQSVNCPTGSITPAKLTLQQGSSAFITASNGSTYQWYRNNIKIPGAISATLTVTAAGMYTAEIINGSCTAFTQNNCEVIMEQPPIQDAELIFNFQGTKCNDSIIYFSYVYNAPLSNKIKTFIWDFGDGEKNITAYNDFANTSHSYKTAGEYKVRLLGLLHSGDSVFSKTSSISIKNSPKIDSVSDTPIACMKKEFSVNFNGNEEQSVTSFVWYFDSNQAGINGGSKIIHTFEKTSYYARLLLSNSEGCTTNIIFNPFAYNPNVDFNIPDTICARQTIELAGRDKNTPPTNHPMYWKWTIGNNEVQYSTQNTAHTFNEPGNKTITLSLTPYGSPFCISTVTKNIHIVPTGALLDFQLPSVICDTNRITLTATNLTPDIPVSNWKWYNNNKIIGEGSSVDFKFEEEGKYKIELTTVTTGSSCISKKEKIALFTKPVAIPDYDFYIPDTIFAGEDITLKTVEPSDLVEDDFQFLWYLNGDLIGVGKTFTRKYPDTGFATLTLVISSNNNCNNSTKKISKHVTILSSFDVNIYTSGNSCVGTDIELYTKTIASREYEIKDYVWRIDNIEIGRGKYLTHKFSASKFYDISLQTISDNPHFNVTKLVSVFVYKNPEIDFGISENVNNLCSGNSISLVGLLNKGDTDVHDWRWTVNEEKIEPAYSNASITPTKDGDHVISLKAMDTHGCGSNTVTKTIKIKPSPEIDIEISNILCIGDTVVAKPIIKNGSTTKLTNWEWTSSGDSFDYSIENLKVRFTKISASEYVTLKATGENGCPSNTVYKNVSVQYGTEARYSVSKNKICIGDTITITDISTANNPNSTFVEKYWNYANANGFSYEPPSGYQNILTGKFSTFGEKKFELVTRNSNGCLSISAPIPIEVLNNPFLGIGIRYDSIIQYADKPLQLQARNAGNTAQYLWKPQVGLNNYNIINPIFNHNQTQDYWVDIFYNDFCKVTDTLNIRVITQFNIHVPGGFSPNGDNNNDVLKPILVGISKLNYFRVYNPQNQLLFETKTPGSGWDGTYKGSPQPVGSYIWLTEGIDINGNVIRKKGNTILLR